MKIIKKIAGVAGAILMGASMMSPVVAASLNDLPAPFINNGVFDANIIVGSLSNGYGLASDLAGAMDIAAAFAQKAMTQPIEAMEGIKPARINSTSGFIGYGDSAKAQELSAEWMLNKTYDDYELIEKLSILNNGGATLNNDGVFKIDFGALTYSINSNSTLTSGQEISILGEDYKIISISPNDEIVFGQIVEEKDLGMPSSFEITGKATVEIKDMDSVSKELVIKVTANNGTVLFDGMMNNNESKSFEDFSFSFKNLRMFSLGAFSIDADWSSSLMTLKQNDNASIISEDLKDWKVKINSNSLVFTSPQYNLNTQPIVLNNGEELDIADYFKIKFEGFDATNLTELNAFNIKDNEYSISLSYENINNSLESVYLGDYLSQSFGTNGLTDYIMLSNSEDVFRFRTFQNDSARYVEVFNQDSTNLSEPLLTLFNSSDANITSFNAGKAVYELTWNDNSLNLSLQSWSDLNAKYLSSLAFSRLSSEHSMLTLVELGGDLISIDYLNKTLNNELGNSNSDFGSKISFSDSQVNIIIPDERITANIWYGRKTNDIEGKDAELIPIVPGIGVVDYELESIVKPSIIVGGGLANSLTQTLSDNNSGVSTNELVNATDKAYFELIEDAFSSNQVVLVVAGCNAKDTRLASQVLAGQISGVLNLDLNGKLAWLNTSVEDYTLVEVI